MKLWTLEERRNRQDLIEVFKMSNGLTRERERERERVYLPSTYT